ncbi:hypothetical protein [uncultured Eubacterium sp.]|uniref:hypothetical protein n=1 Tax=uncultured Eubacterium sp. TaxID=165185 RepID=UPI002671BBAF|nr:hypothetical protein [uncultured Eubacterium sp.]
MKRLAKKLAASVLAFTLVIAMGTTCFAANWGSYFGANEGWYEGAEGKLNSNKASGFTAAIDAVGWGGVWGAQVFMDATNSTGKVSVKKGQTYTLSFQIKATNITKFVYVKVATGETLAYSTWVKVPANKTVKFSKKFKAKANANTVYFGLGGDIGDRTDVSTDEDAATRYKVFKDQYKQVAEVGLANDANGDYTASTLITVSKFTLIGQPKVKSAKSTKKGKVTVKFAKVDGASKYKVKVGGKVTTTKKTSVTVKAKAGKKVAVQVAAVAKSSGVTGAYSAKKSVKVKKK